MIQPLDPVAVRVLGALVEKSLATPDYYPMSLAAVTTACNQRTGREPVTDFSEAEVQDALDRMVASSLVRSRSPAGSRVPKYGHRLADELGLAFGFGPDALAVLCLLMLRGPQTPGELRTRSARLHAFGDVGEVEAVLDALASAERGPYVVELGRRPGQRERRHAHLLGGPPSEEPSSLESQAGADDEAGGGHRGALAARVETLESEVQSLRDELDRLRALLAPTGQG
ncbi:MAG: YceH family protein [Ectothiorhodospiraceae bacterium]|nr:YceH family protein [Chromatiales bacterium]MCP5153553.1 YceH family protein [Ectothiorhodospiraceae bacterium]